MLLCTVTISLVLLDTAKLKMCWVGGSIFYLISLSALGSSETVETSSESGLLKRLGGRRKVRDQFTPKDFCTGSITLSDAKGKEYVVKTTELNVNFKPDSIELLGKIFLPITIIGVISVHLN